jgi:hypothetical protein
MTWITAIFNFISAAFEGLKAALIYDAGKTKQKLESMENEKDLLNAATDARNADSVPDDQDPYNRSK